MNREEQLMEAFRAVCQKYEIGEFFARKLKQLEGWEICLILDDSGSMNTPLKDQGGASAFARSITRWDEVSESEIGTRVLSRVGESIGTTVHGAGAARANGSRCPLNECEAARELSLRRT